MIVRILKELWELLFLVLLAIPCMVLGYVVGFAVNGFVTGFFLQQKIHQAKPTNDVPTKTSP
jgi:hypothetical protein